MLGEDGNRDAAAPSSPERVIVVPEEATARDLLEIALMEWQILAGDPGDECGCEGCQ